MDRRQWSRTAFALALVFGSFPLVGRLVLGDWEFTGSFELACLLAIFGTYLRLRERRHSSNPDPATLLDQASRLADEGRIDRAIALLSRTIRQSPRLWQAYQYRGELQLRIGAHELAAHDFAEAIRLAPEEAHLQRLLEQAEKNS
jgi:tetratricopeptide (TPR) repeat protein